jgi:hypothetical protein
MKKAGLFGLVLVIAAFTGCVGTTALGVWDESIPEESLCTLELRNNLAVIVYDNQPVEWVPNGLTNSRTTISLPPGEHTFMTRYFASQSVNHGSYTQVTSYPVTTQITQEFLPGHSYRIYKQNIWLIFFTITNIKIKDITPKNRI